MTTIKTVTIESFGGMKDRTFAFREGMNLLVGDNGTGKSTLSAFIRFALYGFADKADKKQWMPLDGSPASGALTLTKNGKTYRVERRSGGKHGEYCTVRQADGSETFVGQIPGEALLGIPCDAFLRSAFIRQEGAGADSDRALALDNLLFSADESVNASAAVKKLETARIALWHKNKKGGEIFELEAKCDRLKGELASSSSDNTELITTEGSITETKEILKKGTEEAELLDRRLRAWEAAQYEERRAEVARLKEDAERDDKIYLAKENAGLPNGYKPEFGELAKLDELVFQRESLIHKIERTEEAIGREEARPDENRLFADKLNGQGGEEAVLEKLGALKKAVGKRSTAALTGGLLLIPAALLLASGLLVPALPLSGTAVTVITVAGGVLAAAAIAILIVSLIGKNKAKKERSALLSVLGTDSAEGLNGLLRALHTTVRTEADRLREKAAEMRDELEETNGRLASFAERTGTESGEEARTLVRSFFNSLSALRTEAEKSASAYRSAERLFASLPVPEPCTEPLPEDFSPEKAKQSLTFYRQQETLLSQRLKTKEIRVAELKANHTDPALLAEQITSLEKEISEKKTRHDALVLAIETLTKASDNLRATVSPRLGKEAEQILSFLTDGEVDYLGVDESLGMHCRIGSTTADSSYLSEGTRADAYFALRIALTELLCGEDLPPLFLDETFVFLDPTRLERAMRLLEKLSADRQILLFSASGREIPLVGEDEVVRMGEE